MHRFLPRTGLLPLLLGASTALLLALAATPAHADSIIYHDPDTCREVTVSAAEIGPETWNQITYTERVHGPEKTVPTPLVIRIVRDNVSPEEKKLLDAIGELDRGNVDEALKQLKVLTVGGYRLDLASRQNVYKSFAADDPPGRRKRPPWSSEYAHFFYAKALYLEGAKKKDKDLLEQARLALVDVPIPNGDGKETTGGFLGRFEGGNSRWYAEAMWLYARTLVGLGRYDEAAKAFEDLKNQAMRVDIGPRWIYEAKLGPGVIAEAKGDMDTALTAYEDAAGAMQVQLTHATQGCYLRQIGRYFSRARMEKVRIQLERAEKSRSPFEFQALRRYLDGCTPDGLAHDPQIQVLPPPQREALIQGALDPRVQAVLQNATGLCFLNEKKYEEAVLAFRSVEVKYFEVPEEHARALAYLAEAAKAAAGAAKGTEARKLYEGYAEQARKRLKELYPKYDPGSR